MMNKKVNGNNFSAADTINYWIWQKILIQNSPNIVMYYNKEIIKYF